MEPKDLNSWEEFKERLEKIQEETQELNKNSRKNAHGPTPLVSEPLYRGQSNHTWHLESTLERKRRNMTLYEYFDMLQSIKPKVEETSGISWPSFPNINNFQLQNIYQFTEKLKDTLGYMTFLRQHGFPSPLLDWTSCPYTASYFAFESIDSNTERVAIYFFRHQTGLYSANPRSPLEPNMDLVGHDIDNTSPRHFKQKTRYTLCIKNPNNGRFLSNYIIANMEEDINNPGLSINDNRIEDIPEAGNVVRKYTIPATEKEKVLKELESKEINRESLFESTPDNILIDLWNKLEMLK